MHLARLALLSLLLVGCVNSKEARVAGLDTEKIESYEAQLEELRAQGATPTVTCADQCELSTQTCDVADALCELVSHHPQRPELAPRCARAREACAGRTDTCTRCKTRG